MNVSVEDPYFASAIRAIQRTGGHVDPNGITTALLDRALGGASGSRRYRWDLPFLDANAATRVARFRPREWSAWNSRTDPRTYANRLFLPSVLAPTIDWLAEVSTAPDNVPEADFLLGEAAPRIADDLAFYVTGRDAWGDTFALATFCRYPRALSLTSDLVTAICARYVGVAARHDGLVVGRHFPFHEIPLPSACAHVATAIATLGLGTRHLPELLRFLVRQRRADGGWGDPEQDSDLLTTLTTARLLATLDPTFDLRDATLFIEADVRRNGFAIIGPESRWVENEVASFQHLVTRPFSERFAWPHVPVWALDRNIGVPRFDGFVELADLLSRVPGLADSEIELAFVDLANFGHWNTRFGQAAGDELLRFLVAQLRTIAGARVYRDGGDEFLLVGAPGRTGVAASLREFASTWTSRWAAHRPGTPAAQPRAVVAVGRAHELRDLRETLGRAIGDVKARFPDPEDGVIEELASAGM
jgi:GGDEF domain-containing protein